MFKPDNIDEFINKNRCLEVTNIWSFSKTQEPTDDGLYSKRIFGITQKEQSTKFGYINLNQQLVHPRIFIMLSELSSIFPKVIMSEIKAVITDGMLIIDEKGSNGPGWFYENYSKIKWEKYAKNGNDETIEFFNKTPKNIIFVTKWLVIPALYRPYKEEHGQITEDELTNHYKKLISRANAGKSDNEFMQRMLSNSSKGAVVQKALNDIEEYFLSKLREKWGYVRGSLVSKKMDNVARLVANARPDVPFNCAALPWQVLINIFDAYVVSMIYDRDLETKWAKELNVESYNYTNIADHLTFIYHNADSYVQNNPGLREKWIALLKEMFELYPDLSVIGKRDPSWNKCSYFNVKPIIMTDNSYHVVLNSLLYKPLGGDSFNTNFTTRVKKSNIILKDDNGMIRSVNNNSIYQIKSMYKIYQGVLNESNIF